MEIIQKDNTEDGYFAVITDGIEAGQIFYTWKEPKKMIIQHTDVFPEFKNRGIGTKLVMAAVEFARREKVKLYPRCPFARSVFEKIPEIRDVLL